MIGLIFEFIAGLLADLLREHTAIGYRTIFGIFLFLFLLFAIIHDLTQGLLTLSSILFASLLGAAYALLCTATIYVCRRPRTRKE